MNKATTMNEVVLMFGMWVSGLLVGAGIALKLARHYPWMLQ